MKRLLLICFLFSGSLYAQETALATHVAVDIQTFNAAVSYLGSRPYVEVVDIMEGMKSAKLITITEPEE